MIRITGGEFRGRLLTTPANLQTRPTQARLRQALFNSLQAHLTEARCLDLFAGSGALGFEALSWGAQSVVFVENHRAAVQALQKNIHTLKVEDRTRVLEESVQGIDRKLGNSKPFELIFADPPYSHGWELKLLEGLPWTELLVPGGHFCLEWGLLKSRLESLPEQVTSLVKIREKTYGESVLTTYRLET